MQIQLLYDQKMDSLLIIFEAKNNDQTEYITSISFHTMEHFLLTGYSWYPTNVFISVQLFHYFITHAHADVLVFNATFNSISAISWR
jgi:hypothetical protein